jgi:hypothetical protein
VPGGGDTYEGHEHVGTRFARITRSVAMPSIDSWDRPNISCSVPGSWSLAEVANYFQ